MWDIIGLETTLYQKQRLEVRKWKYSIYQYCTNKMLLANHCNKIHTGPPYGRDPHFGRHI